MEDSENIELVSNSPSYKRVDHTNSIAIQRGKRNISRISLDETQTSLFSKTVVLGTDDEERAIAELKKEYSILKLLQQTGFTPLPIDLKIKSKKHAQAILNMPEYASLLSKSQQKHVDTSGEFAGHLFMTDMAGVSLEQLKYPSENEKIKFSEILERIMNALDVIHQNNIAIVDINSGTFLLDEDEGNKRPPRVNVVDFELAQYLSEVIKPDVQNELKYRYFKRDKGLQVRSFAPEFKLTENIVKAVELHRALVVYLEFYFGNILNDELTGDSLSETDKMRYNKQLADFKPWLEYLLKPDIVKKYKSYVEENQMEEHEVEENIKYELAQQVQMHLNRIMLNIFLPYLLQAEEIQVDPDMLAKMQHVLSPYIEERPSDFF